MKELVAYKNLWLTRTTLQPTKLLSGYECGWLQQRQGLRMDLFRLRTLPVCETG